MATRRVDPLLERAILETELKLGPRGAALRGLLSDAAGTYGRTRRVNASNAAGIKAATQQAQPQVSGAFDRALGSVDAQRAALGVGGPADPQAAAFTRRVGEQRANALGELVQQGVRAESGRVFANESARDEYLGTKAKIFGELAELAGQSGAVTTDTFNKLKDAQAQRGIQRRGQDVTRAGQQATQARADRDYQRQVLKDQGLGVDGKPLPNRGGTIGGVKLASQEQHATARDRISEAQALIKQQVQRGTTSRGELIQLLSTGRPASKVEVDGQEVTVPAVPKLPADYVRAAANLVFDGTLSRKDVEALHNRRLRVKSLGYPTRKKQQGPAQPHATVGVGGPASIAGG